MQNVITGAMDWISIAIVIAVPTVLYQCSLKSESLPFNVFDNQWLLPKISDTFRFFNVSSTQVLANYAKKMVSVIALVSNETVANRKP